MTQLTVDQEQDICDKLDSIHNIHDMSRALTEVANAYGLKVWQVKRIYLDMPYATQEAETA